MLQSDNWLYFIGEKSLDSCQNFLVKIQSVIVLYLIQNKGAILSVNCDICGTKRSPNSTMIVEVTRKIEQICFLSFLCSSQCPSQR